MKQGIDNQMIKSVKKAINILNFISTFNNNPVSLSLISKKLDINNSTCAHIVKTLTNEGYLKKSDKGGYILGVNALCLSLKCDYICYLRKIIQPELNKFVLKHGEEILTALFINGKRRIFCQAGISDSGIDTTLRNAGSGIDMPTGRILLAHASDYERNEYFKENGRLIEFSESKPFANINELNIALNKIRDEKLYILDNRLEIYHAAVPVMAYGKFICAVGSSMPRSRRTYEEAHEIFSDLLSVADRISLKI